MRYGYLVATIVAAGLLFWALARHPYDYYVLLRWVVCAVGAYGAYLFGARKQTGWMVILGVIALMFNPIIPVRLSRETWRIIDIGTATALLISGMIFSKVIRYPNKNSRCIPNRT